MSQKFAVLAILPEKALSQFVIVQDEDPMSALQTAAQSLIDEGANDAQLVAVFTAADLTGVLDQLNSPD